MKKTLPLAIIAAIFLLILPLSIRIFYHQPIFSQDSPYYHLRISNQIKEEGLFLKDPLVQRAYQIEPYHLLLTLNPILLSITLPFACGILTVILLYLILNQSNINPFEKVTILTTFILSPIFIFLFATSNSSTLTLPVILLGLLFFTKEKKYFIPSLIIFAIMPIFGILPSLISIMLLLAYSLQHKSKLKYFYAILTTTSIITLIYQLPFIIYSGLPNSIKLFNPDILTNTISDFGSNLGFGIFTLILFFMGIYLMWRIKKQHVTYFLLSFLIILSFFIQEINMYLFPIVAIFAGYALAHIIQRKWKIDSIKKFTILLIICGLLFSSLSYINRLSTAEPTNETFESLIWLKHNSATTDIIFSHPEKAHWITEISSRPVILDSEITHIFDAKIKIQDTNTIFHSRNLVVTKALLDKYNIKYIYIDDEMKNGQVWNKPQQGLLFLFRNKEIFEQVYGNNDIEIWEILH